MAHAEEHAIGSLITSGLIFFYFQMRLLDGWRVVDQPADKLLGVYIVVVVLAVIAESVLAGILATSQNRIERDERDHAIDARAEANAGIFFAAALNILVMQALLTAIYPDSSVPFSETFVLDTPAKIFFTLLAVLFGAHFVKLISVLVLYRR